MPDVKCWHAEPIGSRDEFAWMEPPRTFILFHHPAVQGAGLGFWGMLPALMPLGGEERVWSLLSRRVSAFAAWDTASCFPHLPLADLQAALIRPLCSERRR